MYGVCLRYSNNEEAAKDILQDGFIKVFSKLEQFSGKGCFEGWVRRVFVNTALERYRNRVPMFSLDEKHNVPASVVSSTAIAELTAGELLRLVQDLSPQYRLVFNLYAIEGYSHKEIAKNLGISEGTSKSNLSRARSILQKRVEEIARLESGKRMADEA